MLKVTVITAVRNGELFFAETIDSIINQTFKDWEYIIIDDNSNDKTVEIVEEFIKDDDRIKLIKLNETKGPFGAANIGIEHAKGKYIIRTDADDISLPNRFKKQVEFLEKNKNIKACVSYGSLIDQNSNETGYKFRYPSNPKILKWFLCLQCPLIHSSLCIEKSTINKIGGYKEESLAQDYRLFTDLSRRHLLSVLKLDLVLFRNHSERITRNKINKKKINLTYQIISDHIYSLVCEKWSLKDSRALNKIGLNEKFSIIQGLKILKRWKNLFKNDNSLTIIEKNKLLKIYYQKKYQFIKKNLFYIPIKSIFKA